MQKHLIILPAVCVVALLNSGSIAAHEPPPAAVQKQMGLGLVFIFEGKFAGSYVRQEKSDVFNGGGTQLEADVEEWKITGDGRAKPARELLKASANGADVTAKRRDELKRPPAPPKKEDKPKGAPDKVEVSFRLPFGEGARDYAYGPLETSGAECSQSFAPGVASKNVKGLLRGRLSWLCADLAPLAFEAELVDTPWYIKRAGGRVVFQQFDGRCLPGHIKFSGEGGFLFYKRRFQQSIVFSDFVTAPVPAA